VTTISASFSQSLDGFIAGPDDSVDHIFDWYDAGATEVHWPGNDMVSRTSPQSAAVLEEIIAGAGALVVGRRIFDVTDGWGGSHPAAVPVFVVTHAVPTDWIAAHPDAPFTFVTDGGVEKAVELASEVAGPDGTVGLAGPNIAQLRR